MKRHAGLNARCDHCGAEFHRKPSQLAIHTANYCSRVCYIRGREKVTACPSCGARLLAHQRKKSCSRACANRLRKGIKYKTGRRKDKAQTIRLLKVELMELRGPCCERCRYGRVPILVVHHKDRNRSNNALENLELLCPNCHAEEHYGESGMGVPSGFENRGR